MRKLFSGIIGAMIAFSLVAMPAQAATTPLSNQAAQQLLSLLLQELALIEQQLAAETTSPTVTTATTTPIVATTPTLPQQTTFDPQALVGILCYYNVTATDPTDGANQTFSEQEEVRGSGVIINANGNILTNRHIIEQPSETTTLQDSNGNPISVILSYSLDHCEVGQLPTGTLLPSVSEIQSLNPYVQIPVLGYTAQPVYVSHDTDAEENDLADFAVLRITGVTANGPTFGIKSVPSSFPYATLLAIDPYVTASTTLPGNVLTYGFPGDVTSGQGNFFSTLTMTGSVGNVTDISGGDNFYNDMPLVIQTDMEIAHGRSGSPLIWRGYVIGLVTFFIGDNRTNSGSVASDAIIKTLQPLGYLP
jgi:S1-C subfamily serine protease